MTDGILLAETQGDRELLAYDTIIVDEAHERSLNIDFLLGYLKQLLPQAARPQGGHHVGHARRGTLRAALRHRGGSPRRSSRFPAACFPSTCGSGRCAEALARARPCCRTRPTTRRNWRRPSSTPPRTCGAKVRATSSCSCPANARSGKPATCCAADSRAARTRARSRSCRCSRDFRWRTSSASSRPATAGASCSPPTSRKPRSRCRASAT